MLAPGTLVDRYELVSPVGEGGMAQVWIARRKGKHGFEKLFAFKCIHTRFADHPAFRSMFLDEARIAAAIEHPNVAQLFDLGEADSMLYLVMEYVDGESLGALMAAAARRVDESVPVPTGVALRIIADACAGLHAAHKLTDAQGHPRGVVHRDVSPHNILVSVRGDVKVIDFGIALAKDRLGTDTGAGSLKGKLHYMAPEQALRQPVGPYTDVYAMGATLYRMLAGHPPHDGGNDVATLQMLIAGDEAPPLPEAVPPLVAAIIERALERDPGDRYQSALEMQTAVEAAIVSQGYVPNVALWVRETLSDQAKERRAALAARTINIGTSGSSSPPPAETPSFVAELGLPAERPPRTVPPPPPALTPPLDLEASDAPPPSSGDVGPPPSSDRSGPGMLDVRALVARVGRPQQPYSPPPYSPPVYSPPQTRSAPPPASRPPSLDEPPLSSPPAQRNGVSQVADAVPAPAREAPRHVGPATPAVPEHAGARGRKMLKLAVAAIVGVLVGAVFLLFLPKIAHDRIIASAREAGIELTIDRVGIGLGGIALKGVTARAQRVPGGELRADEIFSTGWSAREVRVRGAELKLDGHVSTVGPALLAFYDANRSKLAGGGDPRRVSIVSAHVSWDGVLGGGTHLDAGDVGSEIESRSVGSEDVRSTVGHFEIKTRRTTVGPWASSFERNAATSRLRLLFDPPVPDGPSALLVWGKGLSPKLTMRVARSPLARLGIRPDELGLPADPATEAELKLEVGQSPTMRWEATGRLDLYGIRPKSLKGPVDAKLELIASGPPGKPLDLDRTTFAVGLIAATMTGTITPTDFGFALDAAWRTVPIACAQLARAEAKSMGPIVAALQDIAHSTGLARVTGNVRASGVIKYDTKAPDEASNTLMTHEACGLAIFGP